MKKKRSHEFSVCSRERHPMIAPDLTTVTVSLVNIFFFTHFNYTITMYDSYNLFLTNTEKKLKSHIIYVYFF
jgi:hypothetical protein